MVAKPYVYNLETHISSYNGLSLKYFYSTLHDTNPYRINVLPPANGKKLWRVKRSVSIGNSSEDCSSSTQCLNNSLKISAAGKNIKRAPLRRPKNTPGMPKDFVFVDLSPVKSDTSDISSAEEPSTAATTPTQSPIASETQTQYSTFQEDCALLDSISSLSDSDSIFSNVDKSNIFDSSFSGYMQESETTISQQGPNDLGLGLINMDIQDWEHTLFKPQQQAPPQQPALSTQAISQQLFGYQQAMMQQYQQIQLLQQQLQQQAQLQLQQQQLEQSISPIQSSPESEIETMIPFTHKRSKSTSEVTKRRSSGQFQFKTYTGPNKKSKHRRIVSEPIKRQAIKYLSRPATAPSTPKAQPTTIGLEDFMLLNDQLSISLNDDSLLSDSSANEQKYESYSPLSLYSEVERMPKNFDTSLLNCGVDQFIILKQDEFEFTGFVSI